MRLGPNSGPPPILLPTKPATGRGARRAARSASPPSPRPPRRRVPKPPGRRRRWLVLAGVLGVLVVMAGVVAAIVVRRHPGAPARVRALAAGGVRRAAALLPSDEAGGISESRPGRLACVPAVVGGARGAIRTLADVGAAERVTVLWQWAAGANGARAEREAVRATAAARGLAMAPVGSGGAVAVTGPGEALRAVKARTPGAEVVVPSAGSTSVCVLD